MEEWRPIISPFHILIVKDPDLEEDLRIPHGFDHQIYTDPTSGGSPAPLRSTSPAPPAATSASSSPERSSDGGGHPIDAVEQHLSNLRSPATPFFFNTLYDPYRAGADFVRGYPFSMRTGVQCVLSSGLSRDPGDCRYVDAVLTVPARAMMVVAGGNLAFNRAALGPALLPGFNLPGGGARWEAMAEIWCGLCAKLVSDHLGHGVKSGLPYVWRPSAAAAATTVGGSGGMAAAEQAVVSFFQTVRLPRTAVVAEDCVMELAKLVREQLGSRMASSCRLQKPWRSGSSSGRPSSRRGRHDLSIVWVIPPLLLEPEGRGHGFDCCLLD
ncbi:unnamed protein product [Spirodela intermedia]|uniref:Uncharacterized protein n=1 Tax=Spirodela intermedia TaxID=51605 RepID=A0A7I8IRN0_SPIIN|nr:unnamed protein product [Spirodela intermedia]CAA6659824.1 unnamed protein product [Spirodela intermedia]